ncbi:MAG: valine--tRNA ligase [Candidatus Aenigmatarchaeota archaeon]|nr:MAG: valine--tRNA ligase [Candidatus Aenigmarchaeota archaeon]
MQDRYDPKEAEPRIRAFWDEQRVYAYEPDAKAPVFSIDTPPPTVSGKMHIGHSSSYSQQDFIARYKRMRGFNVLYPFGTDDNGLPTERLIEKLKNVRASKMDRTSFIELCLRTLDEIRPAFIEDWKRVGMSCDFSLRYSTIDDNSRRVSQASFLELLKNGKVYRKDAPNVWCPVCQTAIAQAEIEDRASESTFNDVKFKLTDGEDLVIATTRPELLPSCVAVFVHPEDKRYTKLVGKSVTVPLFDQNVEIKTDARVDKEKGTGAVMCCTFGDKTDVEWYKAYGLALVESVGRDGKMTASAGKYKGLDVKEARRAIIEDLKKEGLLVSQKRITHTVGVHERCKTDIEILHTQQWFIDVLSIKDALIENGRKIRWHPEHMRARYENWINNLQWDWCVSRQRYFGVPIPVWYCKACASVNAADEKQLPVDPLKDKPLRACKCGSSDFVPDKDVLDTWATSSTTPQIVRSLAPKGSANLPMALRPQAHDIITTWLFYTVVRSHVSEGELPWRTTAISGHVLDPRGKKMSKSLGNVVEPQPAMDKYGGDALRYWTASAKLGDDYNYEEKELVTGMKTVTKLWNASKFAIQNLQDHSGEEETSGFDAYMLEKVKEAFASATRAFDDYDYSAARRIADRLFWSVFADNYLEIVKDKIYNPDKRGVLERRAAQHALYKSLFSVLQLYAPIMPYVTEEIYQSYFRERVKMTSIHKTIWPDAARVDAEFVAFGDSLLEIISAVRKAKSERSLSMKAPVKRLVMNVDEKRAKPFLEDLYAVLNAEKIEFGKELAIEL